MDSKLRWQAAETGSWVLIGDPLVALGCLTALLRRRRFPLVVALTVAIASTASALATGAALVALGSISTRRPVEIGVVGLAYVTASEFAVRFYQFQSPPGSLWFQLALPALTAGIAVAVGMALGSALSARSRKDRTSTRGAREQTARAAQARALERNRIAREMHDVLAHRISLVAMQAGVLDHRSELRTEESRVLIRGIAEDSRQALEELRDVLGVLRATRATRNRHNSPSSESPTWWPTPAHPDWTSPLPPPWREYRLSSSDEPATGSSKKD
ncbi:sensor histidine kinase [Plantactinospora sp. CA-294935]|uniref:sensor histidine kinase n=1 Tax=Plantactinospora sp. CA-294935 TaxID=3240012 RepID=UPI003D941698